MIKNNQELKCNLSKRLNFLKGNKTLTAFADSVGCSNARMHHYLNKKNIPSADILVNISQVYDVTLDWLIGNDHQAIIAVENIKFLKIVKTTLNNEINFQIIDASIAAGLNHDLLRIKIDKNTVSGIYKYNNMLPTLFKGSLVIIDRGDRKPKNNHLYTIPVDNKWMVKRYRMIGLQGHWCDDQSMINSCVPGNPKVLGRVIGVIKSYNTDIT